ncbi:ribosomal-protein-alanine N-acetyltransferase [Skermania sp. ID1734]|uniref:ribosomal protein S18-alanine N-acetyltransferase n=1 Tax=Skermania sp. ID1734 TaxID=2597516 RepID=UPI00117F10C6|nr:ribosomal protein S18-alanine N-acetyltransferase [Skermania sp. ID1734]TSE02088.1 ribosomal-protein-alanine N-acetyltransferase [Skermania sp. ID1734]
MSVCIVPMADTHVDECAKLELELFPGDSPWSASAFRSELTHSGNRYFVALDDATVVGYAGIALRGSTFFPESEVHTIAVAGNYRRFGLGSQLLRLLLVAAESHGGAVFLEVRTDNDAAIALYRKFGFDIVGTRPNYYQPSGADAFTMRREPVAESVS